MQPSYLAGALKGKRGISSKLALNYSNILDVDAAYWQRAQRLMILQQQEKSLLLLKNKRPQFVCNLPVVTKPWDFILSTQLSNAFHVIDKGVLF